MRKNNFDIRKKMGEININKICITHCITTENYTWLYEIEDKKEIANILKSIKKCSLSDYNQASFINNEHHIIELIETSNKRQIGETHLTLILDKNYLRCSNHKYYSHGILGEIEEIIDKKNEEENKQKILIY